MAADGEVLPSSDLPSLASVYMLDAVLAKVQVALDDYFSKSMVSKGTLGRHIKQMLKSAIRLNVYLRQKKHYHKVIAQIWFLFHIYNVIHIGLISTGR